MIYKFNVGDEVTIANPEDGNAGMIGRIVLVDSFDEDNLPYKVRFEDSNYDYDWYPEDDLELVKTAVEPLESSQAMSVSPEVNKAVVEPVVASEQVSEGRKYDSGKPMYNLLPADALEEVVKVLTYGSVKYNEPAHEENWRKVQYPEQRYFAAMQRHVWATRKGEMNDPESGISHYAHAITSLLFLLQSQIEQSKETK